MKKIVIIALTILIVISTTFIIIFKVHQDKQTLINEKRMIEDSIIQYLNDYSILIDNGPIYFEQSAYDYIITYTTNNEQTFSRDFVDGVYDYIYFLQDSKYYNTLDGEITFVLEEEIKSKIEARYLTVSTFFATVLYDVNKREIEEYEFENGIYEFKYSYYYFLEKRSANIVIDTNTNIITAENQFMKIVVEQRFEILYEYTIEN